MITHLSPLVPLRRCLHSATDGDRAVTVTGFRAAGLARPGPIVSYYRNRSVAGGAVHIGTLVLIVWLIIGAIAAGQRHEYTSQPRNCNQAATAAVTILAGPLNYLGVDPKISCSRLPQPSK
jgi:hypothetical protein